jgi:hypothetical protein
MLVLNGYPVRVAIAQRTSVNAVGELSFSHREIAEQFGAKFAAPMPEKGPFSTFA